jgi:hypothetical protein
MSSSPRSTRKEKERRKTHRRRRRYATETTKAMHRMRSAPPSLPFSLFLSPPPLPLSVRLISSSNILFIFFLRFIFVLCSSTISSLFLTLSLSLLTHAHTLSQVYGCLYEGDIPRYRRTPQLCLGLPLSQVILFLSHSSFLPSLLYLHFPLIFLSPSAYTTRRPIHRTMLGRLRMGSVRRTLLVTIIRKG